MRTPSSRREECAVLFDTTGGCEAEFRLTTDETRRLTTQAYLARSPDFADVLGIWDSYHANHAQKVCVPLLALCATMMKRATERDDGEDAGTSASTRERLALDSLARAIVTKRMRQIYSHLGSGVRVRVNAGLMVLAAIAGRGKKSAAELFRAFDFSLASLPKIATPPRDGGSGRKKEAKDVLAGSTRRAFCEFVLAFFTVKDRTLLRPVLAQRVLFGNVARFSSGDESEMQMRILRTIQDDVMGDDGDVPARLRAAFFGDVVLEQLATISGQSDDDETVAGGAASLATRILCQLFTNPAHGLAPESASGSSKKCTSIIKLLHKLRPIECEAHLNIVLTACETHPVLATMYLPVAKYALEPRLSAHWLNSVSLLGRISRAAGRDAASSLAASRFDASKTVGESEGAEFVRVVIPPGVTKQTLSKGLSHASPMIRHASLCLLFNITRAIQAKMSHLDANILEGRRKQSDRVWKLEELASYARLSATSFLPEVQTIMTTYTSSKATGQKDQTTASIMRCHALNTIALQTQVAPETLIDAKIDVSKLLPASDPTSLPSAELSAVINLLCVSRGLSEQTDEVDVKVSSGQDGVVNQGHLLSVLRVVMFATSSDARASARRLAKHYLISSGALDGRLSEADVWIDKLISSKADGYEHSKDVLMSCTEFLAEAITGGARRRFRHESAVQAHVRETLQERQDVFALSDTSDEQIEAASLSVSALAAHASESVTKVLKSEKRSREFKLAVSTYVASVLMCLVPTSIDPWFSAHHALKSLDVSGLSFDPGTYPALDSLISFLRRCVDERSASDEQDEATSESSPLSWSPTQLVAAIENLSALTAEERGLVLFAACGHSTVAPLMTPGLAASIMYGTSDVEDANNTLRATLFAHLDAATIIASCSSGKNPALGDKVTEAAPARELCARVVSTCLSRDFLRTTRSLVFWAKWNRARGNEACVSKLLDIACIAFKRAFFQEKQSLEHIRSALFGRNALFGLLSDDSNDDISKLVMLDISLSGTYVELHKPYIEHTVQVTKTLLKSRAPSNSTDVTLLAFAANDEKMSLLRTCVEKSANDVGVKIAAAMIDTPESSVAACFEAVRFVTKTALDPSLEKQVVSHACDVASNALEALRARRRSETLSGIAPDFASIPESIDVIEHVLQNSDSTHHVRLASSYVAHSDALALYFLTKVQSRTFSRKEYVNLMPISKYAMRWNVMLGMTSSAEDFAKAYRDVLLEDFFAIASGNSAPSEDASDTLIACVKMCPFDHKSDEYKDFMSTMLPDDGWMSLPASHHMTWVRTATELFAESESTSEKLALMAALLHSLARLTPPDTGSVKRDTNVEKSLADALTRVLESLESQSENAVHSSTHVNKLVKAFKMFTKHSIKHRFRAHRRLSVLGRIGVVLNTMQSSRFEMQSLAESVVTQLSQHPLFGQVLTDVNAEGEGKLPSNVSDMPAMVKSILDVVSDPSSPVKREEKSNAAALKLELLRVLRIFWKLQSANGENDETNARQWRAERVDLLIPIASGYGATLSETDRIAHAMLLDLDASTGGGALRSIGYLWGESVTHFVRSTIGVRRNTDEHYDIDDLLYSDASSALVASAIREGAPPDCRRAAATAARFPISHTVPMDDSAASLADESNEYAPFGYDPSWMLPFTLHALRTNAMEPREAVAWGLASMACSALSSECENMRRIAYAVMATIEEQINDPLSSFRERIQVLSCLTVMRNAVTTPLVRWPAPTAILAAECMLSCLYPEEDTFLPLQRQMNKRASLDLDGLPMFLPMLNSGDVEARHYRLWILRLLRASLKDDVDATIFRKTFAMEVIMSHYSTTLADPFVRFAMLDVVARGCRVIHTARVLVEGGGIIPWLASVVQSACSSDKMSIRSGDGASLRAATARLAAESLVTLIRHKGSIYLGPTGTAADYLSALQVIRDAMLRRDDSNASNTAKRAAIGPYLRLHREVASRLQRRIAEVGDPVEIAELCRTVDRLSTADDTALLDDMFNVIITSEGSGQYARTRGGETASSVAEAVTFLASWAAARADDISTRVSRRAGEEAFEATALWCANAFASGGSSFVSSLLNAPACGGAARLLAIASACAREGGAKSNRTLSVPLIAAHLCLLRAIQTSKTHVTPSEADSRIQSSLKSENYAKIVTTGDALDAVVAASADARASSGASAVIARALLRQAFAGMPPRVYHALVECCGDDVSARKRAGNASPPSASSKRRKNAD